MNMHGQWVVESLFSKFMDDVRNEAHQDHEPNERHKARKCIAVPGMSNQEIGGIGFHQVVPARETRLRVGLEPTLGDERPLNCRDFGYSAASCLLRFGEESSASARFDQAANFNVGFNPTRDANTNSMSALKSRQAPFISADTRGCVMPSSLAALLCVQPRPLMCSRRAAIRSARMARTRASAASKPKS